MGWSYFNDLEGNVCFSFVASTLILVLPLVQPLYKYHLFKMPLFLQVLSFGRAKGEEDPLSLESERWCLSFIKSPFQRFTFQSGVWYIQASHSPVLQWSSKDTVSAVKLGDVCCWPQFHGPHYLLWYAISVQNDNGADEWLRGMPVANAQLLVYE